MNDLVNNASVQTMSSVELVKIINDMREAGQAELRHDNFCVKISKVLGIDAPKFLGVYKNQQDIDRKCYHLPKREANLMVMSESYKVQAAVYDRMVELESLQPRLPKTFSEALRMLADETEAKESALLTIEHQKETIAIKDELILVSNEASIKAGEILVREFVKAQDILEIGEKQFYQWMREQKIISESNEPYQKYVTAGYFTYKPTEERHGGKFRYTLRITPRGKVWLAAKYMAYLDSVAFD